MLLHVPIAVATRSTAWVCGRSLSGIAGSNSGGAWMSVVSVVCCVVSVVFCQVEVSRPEDFYRLWCVWVWLWSLENEEPWPTGGWRAIIKNILKTKDMQILRERLLHDKWLHPNKKRAHQKITNCNKISKIYLNVGKLLRIPSSQLETKSKAARLRGTVTEVIING